MTVYLSVSNRVSGHIKRCENVSLFGLAKIYWLFVLLVLVMYINIYNPVKEKTWNNCIQNDNICTDNSKKKILASKCVDGSK